MAPPAPAATMAAFATIRPLKEFKVEAVGKGAPVGQARRNCNEPFLGTTVIFSEYALAVPGTVHPLVRTENDLSVFAGINGVPNPGPKLPNPRVSAIRHGCMGVNSSDTPVWKIGKRFPPIVIVCERATVEVFAATAICTVLEPVPAVPFKIVTHEGTSVICHPHPVWVKSVTDVVSASAVNSFFVVADEPTNS